MGGFVTWAKRCLKYENRSRGRDESTARGRVVAHRAQGFLAFAVHRPEDELQLFARVAECPEEGAVRSPGVGEGLPVGAGLDRGACMQPIERHPVRPQPASVGPSRRQVPVDRLAVEEAAGAQVHRHDVAGSEPPAAEHAFVVDASTPTSEASTTRPSHGHDVARGPESVAVEGRPDDAFRP